MTAEDCGGLRRTAEDCGPRAARARPSDELPYGFNGCNGFPGRVSTGADASREAPGVVFETAFCRPRSQKSARRRSQSPPAIASHEEPSRPHALRHVATSPRVRRCTSPVWPARWLMRREHRPGPELSSRRSPFPFNAVTAPSVRRSPRQSASNVVQTFRAEWPEWRAPSEPEPGPGIGNRESRIENRESGIGNRELRIVSRARDGIDERSVSCADAGMHGEGFDTRRDLSPLTALRTHH